jgi:hypothetical protein
MVQPRGSASEYDLSLTESYSDMHELSRHIDHIMETLRTAKNTMDAIMADCNTHAREEVTQRSSEMMEEHKSSLKFWALFNANLEHRAVSFNDRLENEISLVTLLTFFRLWL